MTWENLTRDEQIRLAAYTQAAPLVMMDKQRYNMIATVADIIEKANEIDRYIRGNVSAVR